jgi:hypothetical protein
MTGISKLLAALALVGLLAGCSIQTRNSEEKKGSKVDIDSPVGSLHVQTNDQAKHDTGLAVYPGARDAQPDEHDDTRSANVSLGIAGFGLKVVAARYESDDAPEKLQGFYRKALAKYGEVTECHGDLDVNLGDNKDRAKKPACEPSKKEPDKVEMGVTKDGDAHIVSLKPKGNGTGFALIHIQTHDKERETM